MEKKISSLIIAIALTLIFIGIFLKSVEILSAPLEIDFEIEITAVASMIVFGIFLLIVGFSDYYKKKNSIDECLSFNLFLEINNLEISFY